MSCSGGFLEALALGFLKAFPPEYDLAIHCKNVHERSSRQTSQRGPLEATRIIQLTPEGLSGEDQPGDLRDMGPVTRKTEFQNWAILSSTLCRT